MRTKESLWGFFASDPQLSFNEDGEARLFAWIGQEQFERNADGSFTQGETKFYPFKMFRRSAEHAYEKFARGDNFVASGHVQKFSYQKDGETVSGEEFIATHVGPDAARTSYAVNRGRSRGQQVESESIEAPDPTVAQKPSPRPMTL
jgi:single-strand DNA-binding protein